jgi:DNA mismatch repair protein MLH1
MPYVGADGADGGLPRAPRILRLPQDVVNRIAAGEVVVSPAAALKELLENCLDAGATSITVSVRGGGAKLLQVADNGRGIPPADLPLLCERHATSKLRAFDDLQDVSTFGFRGEALASVSHVARVSVLTKTADETCATSAKFIDGVLVGTPGLSAGLDGTTLTVEDLFYNLPTRRRALRPAGEDYRAIVDVVSRYAIKYAGVAFVCRRLAETGGRSISNSGPDVRTIIGATPRDNIRAAFGSFLAQELVEFDVQMLEHGISARLFATKPGFSMKKTIFVMFINGRLVNCGPLKRAVDAAYSVHLPKGAHAFMYLDVTMRQTDVDVNVHPNKTEVRFLHESQLIEAVVEGLESKLKSDGKSRTFLAQALIFQGGGVARPLPAPATTPAAHASTPVAKKRCASALIVDIKNDENSDKDAGYDEAEQKPSNKDEKRARTEGRCVAGTSKPCTNLSLCLIDEEAHVAGVEGDGEDEDDFPDDEDENFINDADDGSDDNGSIPPMPDELNIHVIRDRDVSNGKRIGVSRVCSADLGIQMDSGVNIISADSVGDANSDDNDDGDGDDDVDDDEEHCSPRESPVIPPNSRAPSVVSSPAEVTQSKKKKVASKDKVRTDRLAPVGAMDAFISHNNKPSPAVGLRQRRQRRSGALPMLTSIQDSIADLRRNVHRGAAEILREHTFVGVASERYALVQHQTKLMLVDIVPVITELMYRQILMRFADFDSVKVEPPAILLPFISLAMGDGGEGEGSEEVHEDANECIQVLLDKAQMLDEYYSITITGTSPKDAKLERMPVLFAGMTPDLARAPEFFRDLAEDVDWTIERPCLLGISYALARLYGHGWFPDTATAQPSPAVTIVPMAGLGGGFNGDNGPSVKPSPAQSAAVQREWFLRHVLFESLRFDFDPPPSLADALREVTSTQKLYRIFERC